MLPRVAAAACCGGIVCGGYPPSPRDNGPSTWFDPSTFRHSSTGSGAETKAPQAQGPQAHQPRSGTARSKSSPLSVSKRAKGPVFHPNISAMRKTPPRCGPTRVAPFTADAEPCARAITNRDTWTVPILDTNSFSLYIRLRRRHCPTFSIPVSPTERRSDLPPPASPPSPLPIYRTSLRPGRRPAPTQGSFRSFDRLRTPQAQQTGFARAGVGFPPVSPSAANALDSHRRLR